MKRYKYQVAFSDDRKPVSGTTRATSVDHAGGKIIQKFPDANVVTVHHNNAGKVYQNLQKPVEVM